MHPLLLYLKREDRSRAWLARQLGVTRQYVSDVTLHGGASDSFASGVEWITDGAVSAKTVADWKPPKRPRHGRAGRKRASASAA